MSIMPIVAYMDKTKSCTIQGIFISGGASLILACMSYLLILTMICFKDQSFIENKLVLFNRNNQCSLEKTVPHSFKILPFFVIWYKTSNNKKEYINFI